MRDHKRFKSYVSNAAVDDVSANEEECIRKRRAVDEASTHFA